MDFRPLAYPVQSADGTIGLPRDARGAGVVVDKVAGLVQVANELLSERGVPVAALRVEAFVVASENIESKQNNYKI